MTRTWSEKDSGPMTTKRCLSHTRARTRRRDACSRPPSSFPACCAVTAEVLSASASPLSDGEGGRLGRLGEQVPIFECVPRLATGYTNYCATPVPAACDLRPAGCLKEVGVALVLESTPNFGGRSTAYWPSSLGSLSLLPLHWTRSRLHVTLFVREPRPMYHVKTSIKAQS